MQKHLLQPSKHFQTFKNERKSPTSPTKKKQLNIVVASDFSPRRRNKTARSPKEKEGFVVVVVVVDVTHPGRK